MEKNLIQESTGVKRIVICGPESTGKSTLTKNLATYFKTSYAEEYARDFLQDKWDKLKMVCTKEDLISIVRGQINNENEATLKAEKLIFCDTNILTTVAWSKTHFNGFCDDWIIEQSKKLKYDYYLILNTDIPWVKDDLRDSPNNREKMFLAHKDELELQNVNYNIIFGSDFENRFQQAINLIEKRINFI